MNKTISILTAVVLFSGAPALAADEQQNKMLNGAGGGMEMQGTTQMPPDSKMKDNPGAVDSGTVTTGESESMPNMAAEKLKGEKVYGVDGDKVAAVKKIVKDPAGKSNHAVLTVGGIFGFGGKDVRVPLEEIFVRGDGHLEVAMTEDELEDYPLDVPDDTSNY